MTKLHLNQQLNLKWHALKRSLQEDLESGHYKPGDPLPSENRLSKISGLARNTVRQALAELEKQGLIYRVRGSGTFFSDPQSTKPENPVRKTLEAFCLVIPEIRRTLYPSLVKGFDYRSSHNYHQVMICNTDYDIRKQGDIILQIVDQRMAGVAICSSPLAATPPHHVRQLHSNQIPVVYCHRRIADVPAPYIGWDWRQAGLIAGRCFIANGHRDIAYLGVYPYEITVAYEEGLRQALEENGWQLPNDRVYYGPDHETGGQADAMDEIVINILRNPDRPTAIFCSDDNEAERVFWLAFQQGIKIPDDLSIIGFGNTFRDTVFRRQLISVAVNEYELGVKAAEVLLEICAGRRSLTSNEEFMMPLELTEGCTLGTARK